MFALRDERGLRTVKRNAEPQVVGLAPQTTNMTERANTMKTYLLRTPKSVEPQKRPRSWRATPVPPARVVALAAGPARYVGLDVHNDSIAVSHAPSDSTEVRRYGIIGGQHDDVLKLMKKFSAAQPLASAQIPAGFQPGSLRPSRGKDEA